MGSARAFSAKGYGGGVAVFIKVRHVTNVYVYQTVKGSGIAVRNNKTVFGYHGAFGITRSRGVVYAYNLVYAFFKIVIAYNNSPPGVITVGTEGNGVLTEFGCKKYGVLGLIRINVYLVRFPCYGCRIGIDARNKGANQQNSNQKGDVFFKFHSVSPKEVCLYKYITINEGICQ